MTLILAIDASTEACSVALLRYGTTSERVSDQPRAHADRLLPMVDELLAEAKLELNQLDAISFGAGPGSFTGLRICLGVVQGLAFAAELPVVGVSTLAALALTAVRAKQPPSPTKNGDTDEPVLVAPVVDARMGEVYWAVYRVTGAVVECVCEPQVTAVAEAELALAEYLTGREALGAGSGWTLLPACRALLRQCDPERFPSAAAVAELAKQSFEQGQFTDAATAEPVYLRNEISWKKRERIRGDVTD